MMKVMVIPLTIAGAASTRSTFFMIRKCEAPVAIAASMTPASTSFKALSTSLAKNTIAAIESGTEAAIGPILVPTRIKVKGREKTTRIINGMERMILINADTVLLRLMVFSKKVLPEVRYRIKPKVRPKIRLSENEIPIIRAVS